MLSLVSGRTYILGKVGSEKGIGMIGNMGMLYVHAYGKSPRTYVSPLSASASLASSFFLTVNATLVSFPPSPRRPSLLHQHRASNLHMRPQEDPPYTIENGNGKLQSHRNDCSGRRSHVCEYVYVCASQEGRRRGASTRERAHTSLITFKLLATCAISFLFLSLL